MSSGIAFGGRVDVVAIWHGHVGQEALSIDVVIAVASRRRVVRQVSKSAATGKDPQLMTMHRAKGMEFIHVLIFGANADLLPAAYLLKDLPEEERADLMQRERSLFYVAATRARDELVVMWDGSPSKLIPRNQDEGSEIQ